MLEAALAIDRKAFGNEHHNVAISLNKLAGLLKYMVRSLSCIRSWLKRILQGKFDEAKPLYEEAIAIWRKSYGDEHPSLATGLNDLGLLLKAQVPRLVTL